MKVKVKRTDGSREIVELDDRQHYEVTVEGNDGEGEHPDDGYFQRYAYLSAATSREARESVPLFPQHQEKVHSVRAITHGEAAVMALNGYDELKVG